MNKAEEAQRKLDIDRMLSLRSHYRIFGNIDTHIKPLTQSEIVNLTFDTVFTPSKAQELFMIEDRFFNFGKRNAKNPGSHS